VESKPAGHFFKTFFRGIKGTLKLCRDKDDNNAQPQASVWPGGNAGTFGAKGARQASLLNFSIFDSRFSIADFWTFGERASVTAKPFPLAAQGWRGEAEALGIRTKNTQPRRSCPGLGNACLGQPLRGCVCFVSRNPARGSRNRKEKEKRRNTEDTERAMRDTEGTEGIKTLHIPAQMTVFVFKTMMPRMPEAQTHSRTALPKRCGPLRPLGSFSGNRNRILSTECTDLHRFQPIGRKKHKKTQKRFPFVASLVPLWGHSGLLDLCPLGSFSETMARRFGRTRVMGKSCQEETIFTDSFQSVAPGWRGLGRQPSNRTQLPPV
jgi:hypothetical protein